MITTLQLLRDNRSFARLLLAHNLSGFGSTFSIVAAMQRHADLTGDASSWTIVLLVQAVPFLLFGLGIGYVVDIVDQRRILISCNIAQIGVFTGLSMTHDAAVFLVLMFVASTLQVFYLPAFRVMISRLVEPDLQVRANSLQETAGSSAHLGGFAAAAVALGIIGPTGCFLFDAATFLVAALIMLSVSYEFSREGRERKALTDELLTGFRVIKSDRSLHAPVFLRLSLALIIALSSPIFFPFVVEKGWGGAAETAHLTLSVSLGAIATAWVLARLNPRPVLGPTAVALLLFDAGVLFMIASTGSFSACIVLCLGLGFTEAYLSVLSNSILQINVSKEALGRVFAFVSIIVNPARIVAMVVSGYLIAQTSATRALELTALWESLLSAGLLALVLGRRRHRNQPVLEGDEQ